MGVAAATLAVTEGAALSEPGLTQEVAALVSGGDILPLPAPELRQLVEKLRDGGAAARARHHPGDRC